MKSTRLWILGAALSAFLFLYNSHLNLKTGIKLAMLARLLAMLALPALSNDYFRFIWDGRMSLLGYNPFMVLPTEFVEFGMLDQVGRDGQELYDGQGSISPGNYTCYPPLNQLVFIIPAWLPHFAFSKSDIYLL